MDNSNAGTLSARLAALAETNRVSQSRAAAQCTLVDRLIALKRPLSASPVRFPVAPPPGRLTPAALHQTESDRVTKQRHEPTGHRYVPIGPHELVDRSKIGAAISRGCCRTRQCLSFWNVDDILLYREPESKRTHRERLAKLLDYIIHSEKLSRGYVQYVLEVRSYLVNLPLLVIIRLSAQYPPSEHSLKQLEAQDSAPAGPLDVSHSSPSAVGHQRFVVCREAFLTITGTTSYLLGRAISLFHKNKAVPPQHGNTHRRESELNNIVEGWLLEFRNTDCDRISDDDWKLPPQMSWEDAFAEFQLQEGEICTYETFCRIRAKHFPHIDKHKRSDLPHCDLCSQYRLLLHEDISESERKEVEKSRAAHEHRKNVERVFMHSNEAHAQNHPADLNMTFVDYTTPLGFPHFERTPTVSARPARRICAHLSCVIRKWRTRSASVFLLREPSTRRPICTYCGCI